MSSWYSSSEEEESSGGGCGGGTLDDAGLNRGADSIFNVRGKIEDVVDIDEVGRKG